MSRAHHFVRDDGSVVQICTTDREDGDFHLRSPQPGLVERRRAVMPGDWAVVNQVHGADVAQADPSNAVDADAVMTATPDQPIAVQGADCAPIAFVSDRGPIAVAHAGWRGLVAGVIDETIDRLRSAGADTRVAVVGSVICPRCYEFGADDLEVVARRLGDGVRGETADGSSALDLRAAITAAFASRGVDDVRFVAGCTACGDAGFSHRARRDEQRHALVARIVSEGSA